MSDTWPHRQRTSRRLLRIIKDNFRSQVRNVVHRVCHRSRRRRRHNRRRRFTLRHSRVPITRVNSRRHTGPQRNRRILSRRRTYCRLNRNRSSGQCRLQRQRPRSGTRRYLSTHRTTNRNRTRNLKLHNVTWYNAHVTRSSNPYNGTNNRYKRRRQHRYAP